MIELAEGDNNTLMKRNTVTIAIAIHITQRTHGLTHGGLPGGCQRCPVSVVVSPMLFLLNSDPTLLCFSRCSFCQQYAAAARCMLGHPRAKTFRQTAHDVSDHTLTWMWSFFFVFFAYCYPQCFLFVFFSTEGCLQQYKLYRSRL